MKYTKEQARSVIKIFQEVLHQRITIIDYHVEKFFHVFKIEPFPIDGTICNAIRFKDTLVQDCIISPHVAPDMSEIIKACFVHINECNE